MTLWLCMAPVLAVVLNTPLRPVVSASRLGVVEARAQEGLNLATDIKGKAVWNLRKANDADAAKLSKLSGGVYPNEILLPLLSSGHCLVGESNGQLVSAALVHTFKGLKDQEKGVSGGLDERADLISVLAAEGLPSEMRVQTALGALKLLKAKGFSDVLCAVSPEDKENVDFVKQLGLSATKTQSKDVLHFEGPLMSMNPDPQKKIKD